MGVKRLNLQRSFWCTAKRNANFAHSAFQEAPRTFLQLWGHGRRFWGVAARSGLGQEASASGDNGNLRG